MNFASIFWQHLSGLTDLCSTAERPYKQYPVTQLPFMPPQSQYPVYAKSEQHFEDPTGAV